ncbi:MAG TPA: aminoglycoside phosphotransferase family protein [Actinomycetota bacterium]|nr:aminoglycoside phosphotransferase family protein [Actinomycetota bacterium]
MTESRVSLAVPRSLAANCRRSPGDAAWLERLPQVVDDLRRRWSLELEPPFDGPEVSAAWVAPVRRPAGPAVLKVSLPHMEADHEIDGLRFWSGDPTVRLLEADEAEGAMLLERCEPGTWLRERPEPEQDVVIAGLLRRLWRVPADPHPFRPLSDMLGVWIEETLANEAAWADPGLVREGLRTFEELSRAPGDHVLLSTDLHAGNVLAAEREPWLVIDAMPFVGDPAYDATQHLRNCQQRMLNQPIATIERFADQLEVDGERVRRWMFARAAAENRDDWNDAWAAVARALRT